MVQTVNKAADYIAKMRREGKVKILDISEDIHTERELEKARREFRYKSAMSEIEASQIILTC